MSAPRDGESSREDAHATALNLTIGESPAWDELTFAEQEVAVPVAAGLTNTAIAVRRGTSSRTVDSQVASVLSKLMLASRRDIMPLLPVAERDRADREARRRSHPAH
ncbi:helix-turn-helix transcriptional regulator [Nocardia sp. NPDC101769]|uniref:helix-turn-helix domain-containing protein n=1 Tax=Nocardia sp. NPDC101769 TaxID=3364333 RepID=UPI0037F1660B